MEYLKNRRQEAEDSRQEILFFYCLLSTVS